MCKILEEPAIRRYYADFGREGDVVFIALSDDKAVGAVWVRLATTAQKGYGFVRSDVPELAIAVLPAFRGRGIGTALLEQMLTHLHATGLEAVSLSVSRSNPARKLYERHGFSLVKNQKNSCTMLIELTRLCKLAFSLKFLKNALGIVSEMLLHAFNEKAIAL